jgi:hypothetical protein
MFGRTKQRHGPPDRPFVHQDGCKILAADRDVQIEWSRIEGRRWERICACGAETWYEPESSRVRLDPYDPATMRHLPQCEFASTTDHAILRALLKITPKDGYAWVECGGCQAGWQVADFAEVIADRAGR